MVAIFERVQIEWAQVNVVCSCLGGAWERGLAGLAVTDGHATPTAAPGLPFRVWPVPTGADPGANEIDLLSDAERRHCSRLSRAQDRDAFALTRITLRKVLADLCGTRPQDIEFTRNLWGKLSVAGAGAETVDFSVSHAADLSVIAVSAGRAIGIDIERLRSVPDRLRIATDVFGEGVAQQLQALPAGQQDVVFLQLWTAGEAFLKAQGLGFAGWGGKVPVKLAQGSSPQVLFRDDLLGEATAGYTLVPLLLPPGFIGNVVTGRLPMQHRVIAQ